MDYNQIVSKFDKI